MNTYKLRWKNTLTGQTYGPTEVRASSLSEAQGIVLKDYQPEDLKYIEFL